MGNTQAAPIQPADIRLPRFAFAIAGRAVSLLDIGVKTASVMEKDRYFYGNIGQNLLTQFAGYTLNFRRMFVRFSPNPR